MRRELCKHTDIKFKYKDHLYHIEGEFMVATLLMLMLITTTGGRRERRDSLGNGSHPLHTIFQKLAGSMSLL